jgi:hypothetical protein
MMDHERIEELIAAYALDALDDEAETQRMLLDHIAGCTTCQRTFLQLRETAGDLALAAPPVPVPKTLEKRIMESVRGDRARPVKQRERRPLVAAAAAALILVAGMAAWNVRLAGQLSEQRNEAAGARRALEVLADPAAHTVTMRERGGDGVITVALRAGGSGVLVGEQLSVPPGHLLELWLLKGTRVEPSVTFVPVHGAAVVEVPAELAGLTGLALTVERERVAQPTTVPIFESAFPA